MYGCLSLINSRTIEYTMQFHEHVYVKDNNCKNFLMDQTAMLTQNLLILTVLVDLGLSHVY